jgi:glycosyltransferase involved in cell wall biosynthesis
MKLRLASASPRRRELLDAIGLGFEVVPADVDEQAAAGALPPLEAATAVATAKAQAIPPRDGTVILAAATMVVLEDRVIGKPASDADAQRMLASLRGRTITAVPRELLEEHPFWEVMRMLADKAGADAPMVDRIWDHLCHDFTRAVGRRLMRRDVEAVYAYEYTALEAFQAAERCGAAKILDFPSLNSRRFEELQRREKEQFPELIGPHESFFSARFERRQARRDAEMAAANVIITNSNVTRRSHIESGADPEKTFAVPLGAPPTIDVIPERGTSGPLQVIWAGTFSIRKGAHYFIDAWRALGAGIEAAAQIYGTITLPERAWKPLPPGMTFHGPARQADLFAAFDAADVLMFPTLSDGFGMVVTEAFARGLPVVTTDQAGASDLVAHQRNGLIIPAGDSAAITAALRWCLNNRTALAAMRPAALETARGWQLPDYRRALIEAIATGLARTGRKPRFGNPHLAAAE